LKKVFCKIQLKKWIPSSLSPQLVILEIEVLSWLSGFPSPQHRPSSYFNFSGAGWKMVHSAKKNSHKLDVVNHSIPLQVVTLVKQVLENFT